MVKTFSAQITTRLTQKATSSLNKQLRKVIETVLSNKAVAIEKMAELAGMEVIEALAHNKGSYNVSGKSFPFSSSLPLISGPIKRLLQDEAFIGEIGIPDPEAAVLQLIKTLPQSVDIRARVFRGSIQISARFRPERLLRLNPHPGRMTPNGQKISVQSWLQWTVGPNFDSQGTPGFGLVRVNEILTATAANQFTRAKREQRLNMASASRTFNRAGENAGLMLKLQPVSPGAEQSQVEAFTGRQGRPWRPSPAGRNFWQTWWKKNAKAIKVAFSNIAGTILTTIAQRYAGARR